MIENNDSSPTTVPARRGVVAYLLRWLVGIAAGGASLAAVSFLLIYPLWYLATQKTEIYTVGVLALVGALILALFILRWRRAALNSRLDEFYLKTQRVLAFAAFLLSQAFTALANAVFFLVMRTANPQPPAIIGLAAPAALSMLATLVLIASARRRELFRQAGFVFCSIVFSLQCAYWAAAFFFQGTYLYSVLIFLIILGFFFYKKITKMITEKKNPDNEAIRH
jgi:hypothetical protein